MRKTCFILFVLALTAVSGWMVSCGKQSSGTEKSMTFNIKVMGTKSENEAWSKGDKLLVFFDEVAGKYISLVFDGINDWTVTPSETFLESDFKAVGNKRLTAIYFPVAVDVSYADGKFSFSGAGEKMYSYYVYEKFMYIVDGSTVVATLTMGKKLADFAVFHVAGLTSGLDRYTLGCPLVSPVACTGIGIDGTIMEDVRLPGARIAAVADGAFVILRDVNINGTKNEGQPEAWAGITPLGDAILLLEGTNTVQSFGGLHPGIFAAEGHTLTIRGDGKLTVKASGAGSGIGGGCHILFALLGRDVINCGDIVIDGGTIDAFGSSSGIGGPNSGRCGNITINGGNVNATGKLGAGIGAGMPGLRTRSSCGNITINGGTVTAQGSLGFAGIGSGTGNSFCGNITISPDVERVQATKGNGSPNAIGSGQDGRCGIVTIGGTIYWDGRAYQNNGRRYLGSSPLVYPAP